MASLVLISILVMIHSNLGVYHNLLILFEKLNCEYFQGDIDASIVWGKKISARRARRSIILGSYCDDKRRITIHRALDQALVPKLCVERILHHEMLHQIYPVERGRRGQRIIHTRAFRQAEKGFRGAELADRWIKENLDKILTFGT